MTLASNLFATYRAYSTVDWAIFEKLQEIFGEDAIADTAHDSYDVSLEIYADEDIVPTREQADAVLAMGFAGFWLNFKDETEIAVTAERIGERRKRSYGKWGSKRERVKPEARPIVVKEVTVPCLHCGMVTTVKVTHDGSEPQIGSTT